MRKLRMFTICALVLGALGATAASASAYSLGPAGTKVSATGYVGIRGVGSPAEGFQFGPAIINCGQTQESGTLDGSATVTLNVTFSACGNASGTATVSAPGGMRLSVISSEVVEGRTQYNGQLTTGAGGLTITSGACTVTVPPNLPLVNVKTNPQNLHMQSSSSATQAFLYSQGTTANVRFNPYTGSSGCSAEIRGTHSTGFGLGFFHFGTFQGMVIS